MGEKKKGFGCCSGFVMLGILGAVFLVIIATFAPSRRAPEPEPSAPAADSWVPLAGGVCVLRAKGAQAVALATTYPNFEELTEASGSKALMERLIEQGKILVVPNGTAAVIVKTEWRSMLVRITEGPLAREEGWIQRDSVAQPK